MDRGNPRITTLSLVIISTVLLIAQSSFAAPPTIGKQPGSRAATKTKVIRTAGNGSFLGGLLGRRVQPKSKSDSENRNATPVNTPRDVSWDGIPFHTPGQSTVRISNAPIRDPGIQRSPSPRVSAIPAATRIPKPPVVKREPALKPVAPRVISAPRREVTVVPEVRTEPVPTLSDRNSSRRSGRRDVGKLDISEIEAAARGNALQNASDLIPKVSRRVLESPKPEPKPEPKPAPKVEPKPEPVPAPVEAPVVKLDPPKPAPAPKENFVPRKASVPTKTFNTASAPIGSGVVPESEAIYRKPILVAPKEETPYVAQAPQYQSFAPVPAPPVDPYANAVPMQDIESYEPVVAPEPEPIKAAPTATLEPGKNAVASELPGIRVVTNGPSSIMIRQTHQFEIRVENRGSIDAAGVMVRALIPDWAEIRGQTTSRGSVEPTSSGGSDRLTWKIENLPAGTVERMFVRLRAERSGTHGLDVDWTLLPQKSVAKVHVHEPQLKLTIEGPDQVTYGESQAYKVRVLNPGDGIAPNVVFTLSPNSATPQTQRIGDIPSGKEAQFEVELTAMDLGDLKIHGLASGDLDLRAEAHKKIRVAAAKLEAMLTGPELKYRDTDSDYHLQIQNTGVVESKNITAQLRMPVGATYVDGLDGAIQRGDTLTWNIESLTPGAVRDYKFRCKLNTAGDQLLSFSCKGTAAGQADVAITTRVESVSDLVMTISDPIAPAPVGSEVMYEVLIRNRGSKEAKDVRAIAQFSHGIEPRRVNGHPGEVLTGQVLFDTIPKIEAGGEVKLKIVAIADRAGHHRFRTEIRSGDTVLVAEEATHYMSAKADRVSRRSTDAGMSLR